ncbi:MAG: thioredoxin domain-containing protein [Flavobacteriaceae bacterium]|nr:thioredoxin domain-containing protein [Flavobacteriaceae bacterium]
MEHPTNALINETSPYLLQHANNPVDWHAWNTETLAKANESGKLLLISIGYASCHWCHVMEKEVFEDTTAAALMNQHFINIKVDREERPDVDQIYMNAVQLMTGSGGWPLNVVALPDGRPVWGGTYFRKDDWMNVLTQIAQVYKNEPKKFEEYAQNLTDGVRQMDLVESPTHNEDFAFATLENLVQNWKPKFDLEYGGNKGAPKFMMPTGLNFLLRYGFQANDTEVLDFVHLTLQKMAFGGLYDHVGGGFSRYSVDNYWHVPHFEKMLYDNAQLVSLYANAYLQKPNPQYKRVVYETLSFIEREMTNPKGGFYASFDADSEGEEGKFYVWTKDELQALLEDDFDTFATVFNINDFGLWEEENYVLIQTEDYDTLSQKLGLTVAQLTSSVTQWKQILFQAREKRKKPALDDKTLSSWNAMMIRAYADAYRAFGEKKFLDAALQAARFLDAQQSKPDGGLWRNYKDGKSTINAFMDDYALTIDAYLSIYENTFDQKWLQRAKQLTDYTFSHFYNPESGLFFYTSDLDPELVSRTTETSDNVIPASNSIMAKNLFLLGYHFDNETFLNTASGMLRATVPAIGQSGAPWYANWLNLMLNYTKPFYEVAFVGETATQKLIKFTKTFQPNLMLAGSTSESDLPLLKHRFVKGETLIYVCQNYVCKLPVKDLEEARALIKNQ